MEEDGDKKNLTTQYDSEQDIFYLLFTENAHKAIAEEVDDEVFVRFDPETRKVISVEFLNFHERVETVFGKEMKYFGSERPERILSFQEKDGVE